MGINATKKSFKPDYEAMKLGSVKFAPIDIQIDNSGKRNRILLFVQRLLVYIILILLCLLCLFPFYVLIVNCTRQNSEIQQGFSWTFGTCFGYNWNNLFNDKTIPMAKAFGNSLFISLCSSVLCVYFSAMTAYAFHQYNFKFKKVLYTIVLITMMIPTQVSTVGLIKECRALHMMDTYWPLILPSIASPVVVFFMKQYLDSVMPNEIVEAARVDGAGELRTFHQIVLPILKPALAVQFIFCFVSSWNNYFVPAMLITSYNKWTIPLVIASLRVSDPRAMDIGKVYMILTVAIVPLLIVYLIFSKFIIKGVTLGSVKG